MINMQAGILRCSNLMTRPKLKSAGGWAAVVTVGEADYDKQEADYDNQ